MARPRSSIGLTANKTVVCTFMEEVVTQGHTQLLAGLICDPVGMRIEQAEMRTAVPNGAEALRELVADGIM